MSHVTFSGLSLLTAPGRVMTPRAATEQLVAAALERLDDRRSRVVDVGTGCGAIAIAIAAAAPEAEVWATDTSRPAVALARLNVRLHGLEDRVHVRRGDLLEPIPAPVDLIVANLPYLPIAAASGHPELAHEPWHAVFAGGDGLGPYRRLLAASEGALADDGAVVLQLHRRPIVVERADFEAVRLALDRPRASAFYPPALVGAAA